MVVELLIMNPLDKYTFLLINKCFHGLFFLNKMFELLFFLWIIFKTKLHLKLKKKI
jgi:hypothetical protein